MKIVAITAHAVQADMRIPYITAMVRKTVSTSVVTVVRTDDGQIGVGQATTSAQNYSRFEEFQSSICQVVQEIIAPALMGVDPCDLEEIHLRMNRVAKGHLYAHSTVDLACHDWMGRAIGRPVVKLIGGALRERLPLCAPHLGIVPADDMAAQAAAFVAQGYQHINLRVGLALADDVRNVMAVRAAVGPDVAISVDFSQSLNGQGFRNDTAIVHLRALEKAGVNAFEQPVADGDLEGLAKISAAIDAPVIADEAIRTLQDALRLVQLQAADAVKIKLMKVGGIHPARKIAAVLQAAGIPVTVGNGLAGAIANSAEAHFAFSLPNLKLPGEMNGFLRLHGQSELCDLVMDGCDLLCPTQPGLGLRCQEYLT